MASSLQIRYRYHDPTFVVEDKPKYWEELQKRFIGVEFMEIRWGEHTSIVRAWNNDHITRPLVLQFQTILSIHSDSWEEVTDMLTEWINLPSKEPPVFQFSYRSRPDGLPVEVIQCALRRQPQELCFSRMPLGVEQSRLLACSSEAPQFLRLQEVSLADTGAAFFQGLQSRTTPFGSLQLHDTPVAAETYRSFAHQAPPDTILLEKVSLGWQRPPIQDDDVLRALLACPAVAQWDLDYFLPNPAVVMDAIRNGATHIVQFRGHSRSDLWEALGSPACQLRHVDQEINPEDSIPVICHALETNRSLESLDMDCRIEWNTRLIQAIGNHPCIRQLTVSISGYNRYWTFAIALREMLEINRHLHIAFRGNSQVGLRRWYRSIEPSLRFNDFYRHLDEVSEDTWHLVLLENTSDPRRTGLLLSQHTDWLLARFH